MKKKLNIDGFIHEIEVAPSDDGGMFASISNGKQRVIIPNQILMMIVDMLREEYIQKTPPPYDSMK